MWKEKKRAYILTCLGEPRQEKEITNFVTSISEQTNKKKKYFLPLIYHKQIKEKKKEFSSIGAKNHIFEKTEIFKNELEKYVDGPVFCFFHHLPKTYAHFFDAIKKCHAEEFFLFPSYPQFSYTLLGKIASFFKEELSSSIVNKFRWVKSYCGHEKFIKLHQDNLLSFLKENELSEKNTIFLFTTYGTNNNRSSLGDLYEYETQVTCKEILKAFPYVLGKLAFEKNIFDNTTPSPQVDEVCKNINCWNEKRTNIVFVPISDLSHHMNTTYAVEKTYIPLLEKQGFFAHLPSPLISSPHIPEMAAAIIKEKNYVNNKMLIF